MSRFGTTWSTAAAAAFAVALLPAVGLASPAQATASPQVAFDPGETITVDDPGPQAEASNSVVRLQITATDSLGKPMSFTATGLPPGLSMDAFGLITGTIQSIGNYSVTVMAHSDATYNTDTFPWTVVPYGSANVVNGGFEVSGLSGWIAHGVTAATASGPHSGTSAALLGSTAPSSDSTLTQTFTVPSGNSTLGFWYTITCPDSVVHDWAEITVQDLTSGVTVTPLAPTCVKSSGWLHAAMKVTVGHKYTVTLLNHDDGAGPDPTYTKYDDVTLN